MNVYCVKDSGGQFCKIDADLIKVDNGLVSFYKEVPRSTIPNITLVDNVLVAALKDPMLLMQPTPNNVTPEEETQ